MSLMQNPIWCQIRAFTAGLVSFANRLLIEYVNLRRKQAVGKIIEFGFQSGFHKRLL